MNMPFCIQATNVWLCLLLLAGAGCKSIGPKTVQRDRMHYSTAVADSWKEQLLLNIVKTRYGDAPAFMEVVSVVSGYSVETALGVGGQFSPESLRGDTFATAGASSKFTDRPTISYAPMTGEKFARSLMAPVPLDALLFVMQGGVPADFMLGLTLQAFEGHHNADTLGGEFRPADPQFLKQVQLVGALQRAKAIETEVLKQGDQVEVWLRFHQPAWPSLDNAPATEGQRQTVRIQSGKEKPANAFAAVRYRDPWFWIDNGDLLSKRSLTMVMFFFTLSDTGSPEKLPLITIPAQ